MGKGTVKGKQNNLPKYFINEEIRWKGDVYICGEGVDSKVISITDARLMAEQMGLDLIDLNTRQNPPVMKIASYEKMMYGLKKKKKSQSKQSQVKEIQLTTNIAKNDMLTKAKMARKFIDNGDRVKVVLRMRGRELSRREVSKLPIFEFIDMMNDVAVAESIPKDEGNRAIVYLKRK